MTVFITIWFGLLSSIEILMLAPAFIKRLVNRIISVPAIKKLTLEAKKVLSLLALYILKIKTICLFVKFLNSGYSCQKKLYVVRSSFKYL